MRDLENAFALQISAVTLLIFLGFASRASKR